MPLTDRLPMSRIPDPVEAPPLRWGVIGAGWIAERFVDALQSQTRQEVVAVGSRSPGGATAFAERFDIPRPHGSYEDLVSDPEVDVVYVATPHPSHLPYGLLALNAGKHILIEKPLALNAREARELQVRAAELALYCAEAMWTLFTPKFDVIRQVLDAGMLGEIRTVIVDFGEWFADDHRIMRPELAGGPLLDLGTYPISLAHWVLGMPVEIIARGIPASSGVNGQASVLLVHDADAHSVITTSLFSNTPTGATIAGTEGTLTIPGIYYRPGGFTVVSGDQEMTLSYEEPTAMYAYLGYEAAETARRIIAGETSTPYRPMADTVSTMEIIDEVRRQIGIVFPGEQSVSAEGKMMEQERPQVVLRAPDDGDSIVLPMGPHRARITRKAARTETDGHWAVGEAWQDPGFDNPPHTHDEAEAFYVLEGSFTFYTDADPVEEVGPGTFVFIPPGAVHGFRTGPQGGKLICFWPSTVEAAFFNDKFNDKTDGGSR